MRYGREDKNRAYINGSGNEERTKKRYKTKTSSLLIPTYFTLLPFVLSISFSTSSHKENTTEKSADKTTLLIFENGF